MSENTVRNAKVTETYERSPSAPSQLIVNVTMAMSGQQVSVRRVYDALAR